jgi:enterochelin esterase family protein
VHDEGDAVTFELRDNPGRLRGVRLIQEVGLPGPLEFSRAAGRWTLSTDRPDVDRMEYLFEIDDRRGRRSTITDPTNPRRVGGAFGDKSVLEFPEYAPPAWLDIEPVDSACVPFEIDAGPLDGSVEGLLWTPSDLPAEEAAPLVLVHDGPEFAKLGGITHYLGAAVAIGELPPLRAALLDPGSRDDWYAANPRYSAALCEHVVPALEEKVNVSARVGVGASLGGLAMLHAHRCYPRTFDALLLQSASFFTAEHDPQEADFGKFGEITAFVRDIAQAHADAAPIPVVLTCGTVEENLANNRAMTAALRRLGYPAELVTVRDAHNYTAWRDALDPHLTRLVRQVADGARAA